ncbi:PREDICTED: guanine nucleotide-binding protein-like 3 homolog [Amphimedon queenslandica]|nr:PREDICTED: guanine nucleotide-binding protein-like 3 homolog [Amphimedon queenslandica]|eukprot:XP_019855178.1 PREDICTED: guanine nucleotide-binding protein-like 3 homolog [Amphimedon queenslandica]
MQLAKLVQAGSLSIPRGLDAYFDDRLSLLDQLFTILTQQDIHGLLPDILKGLKMKKIKELCLKELEKLDNDQLLSIITDTQEEGKEKEERDREDEEKEEEEREGDIEAEERSKQDTFTTSSAQDQSLSEVEEGEISPRYDHAQSPPLSPPSIHISDVSDEEYKTQVSHDQSCDQVIEYEKEQSLDEDRVLIGISTDAKNDDIHLSKIIIDSEREKMEEVDEDCNDDDDDDDDGWSKDVSEQQKLLEMKIRKRLLENQVKRLQERPLLQPEGTDHHQNVKKGIYPQEVKRGEGTGDISSDSLNNSEVLEMRMREKALKSLLAKKGDVLLYT